MPIIAPLLTSVQGMYSTFSTISKQTFSDYYNKKSVGILPVSYVRECYLIKLTFEVVRSLLENVKVYPGDRGDWEINTSLDYSGNPGWEQDNNCEFIFLLRFN